MKQIKIECKNCHAVSIITEEKLIHSGTKSIEEAYCLDCKEKIFVGQTDGWFSVSRLDKQFEKDKECTYPMA